MHETYFAQFKTEDCYKYLWLVLEIFPKWLLLNFSVHWAPAAERDLQVV